MGGGDLASAPDVAEKDVEAARDGAHLVGGVKAGSRLVWDDGLPELRLPIV